MAHSRPVLKNQTKKKTSDGECWFGDALWQKPISHSCLQCEGRGYETAETKGRGDEIETKAIHKKIYGTLATHYLTHTTVAL